MLILKQRPIHPRKGEAISWDRPFEGLRTTTTLDWRIYLSWLFLKFLTVGSSLGIWMDRLTAQSPAQIVLLVLTQLFMRTNHLRWNEKEANFILSILHWRLLCLVVRGEREWLSGNLNLSWARLGGPKLDDQIFFEYYQNPWNILSHPRLSFPNTYLTY